MEHGSVNLLLIGESERSFPAVDRGTREEGILLVVRGSTPVAINRRGES